MTASKKQKKSLQGRGRLYQQLPEGVLSGILLFSSHLSLWGGCHSLPGPHCKTAPVPSERQK